MNRIYRTLWSAATQSWQAVPETAKSAGKKNVKSSAAGVVASVALSFALNGGANAQAPPAINQLPTGGNVVRGTATISQTATAQAAAMTVNQSTQRAAINWNTFNLGSAASMNFVQPNAQAVTLNRVNDSNPSQIFGRITANGQVFISNANGVYFAPGSSVDVGAITATTHSISDDNFMSGNYVFERNGATGQVVNEGHITAALSGYVALLAPEVQNAGVVVAQAGTVAMAAGEMITLKIEGGNMTGIITTPSAIASLVDNKHAVLAPDGQIILSAVALNKLQAGVIKNSGRLEVNSLVSKGGKIYLEGDDITLTATSKLEAKGPAGGGTVLVGGDWQGSGDMRQATKVTMEAGATIDASATDKGDGGKVVLWSDVHNADSVTRVNGSIKAEAGPNGGDGGRIETSGHMLNVDGIGISAQSPHGKNGEWLLDPYDVYIMKDTTTSGETFTSGTYTPSSYASYIKSSDLNNALNSASVTVTTGGASSGTATGNIYVYDGVAWNANKLTLNAWNNIYVYFPLNAGSVGSTASLALQYGQSTAGGGGSAYYIDAPIYLPAGANFSTQQGSNTANIKNYTVITSLGIKADATTAPTTMTLQGMAASTSMAGNFVLGADIDATTTQTWGTLFTFQYFTPIGSGSTSSAFSGIFDGLGHSITNLKVKNTSSTGTGLFGGIKKPATIRNLSLLNETVIGSSLSVGGLFGTDDNAGVTISNIYTSGSITNSSFYTGGIAGVASGGSTMTNVSSSANVTSTGTYTGGLFGSVQANTLSNAAYYGTVTGTSAGAIFGNGSTKVTSVYYDSTKNSTAYTGTLSNGSTVVTAVATANLSTQSNFSGLDFVNSWYMGASYPLPQFMATNILRVVPTSTSVVYGNTPTVSPTLTYAGLHGSDTPTDAFTGGVLPTVNASIASLNVGATSFSASGGTSSTYAVVYDPATSAVTPKPLTINGLSVATTKVYNNSTAATVSGTATLQSPEAKGAGSDTDGKPYTSDTVSVSGPATASYNSKVVATATTITYGGLTLGGTSAANYSLSYPAAVSGNITPRALTVTGLTLTTTKTYDGTNTAAVTGTLSGSSITGGASTSSSTDGKYFTSDGITLTAGVTPSATYSQSDVGSSLKITYSSVGALNGTYASNYYLSGSTTGTINKATLSLTGSQVYNGSTTFLGTNLTATGALGQSFALTGNNATLTSADVTLSPISQSFTGLSLGASGNGGLASNYNAVASTSNVNVSITPATAKLSGLKVYDGTVGLVGAQLSITGVTVNGTAQTLSYTAGTGSLFDPNVSTPNNYVIGSGLVLGNGTGLASNYTLPSTYSYNPASNTASVSPATATVTANKNYNGDTSLSAGQVTITGVSVNGGAAQTLGFTGTATLSDANAYTPQKYVNTGSMLLANGTGSASNYVLPASAYDAAKNTAIIQKQALTATDISASTSVYGDPYAPGTVTFTNKVSNTDDVNATVTVTVPAGSLSGGGVAKVGNYSQSASNVLTGAQAGNYSFTGLTSLSANYSVTQRALVLSGIASGQSLYANTMTPGAALFSNAISHDDVSTPVTVNTSAVSTSGHFVANTYTQTASSVLTGADKDNYTLIGGYTTPTANYTIQPKPITVASIANGSSTYASTLAPGAVTLNNIVSTGTGTDDVSSIATVVTRNNTSTSGNLKADTYAQTAASNSLSGADAGNYTLTTFTTPTNNYTVDKLALTASGDIAAARTTYGSPLVPGTLAFANKVVGDAVGAVVSVDTSTLSSGGKPIVGNYTQTASTALSGVDAGNYSFVGTTSSTPNYTIDPLALTGASIASGTSVYASSIAPGAVTFGNAVAGDRVSTTTSVNTSTLSTSGHPIAGGYTQTASTVLAGDDASNYTFAGYTSPANYTIQKLALAGASIAASNSTYSSTLNPGAVTFTNIVSNGTGTDDVTSTATVVTGATSTSGNPIVGTYAQRAASNSLSGADAGNYSFTGFTTSTNNYTIDKLALAGASIASSNSTYGSTLNPGAVTFTNIVSNGTGTDNVTSTATVVTGATSTSGKFNAGTYAQTAASNSLSGTDASNYSFAGFTTSTNNYTIDKLALAGASIASSNNTYSSTLNPGAVTFTNIVSSGTGTDDVGSTASVVTGSTSQSGNPIVGTYAQTAANNSLRGTDAGNYSFAGFTTSTNNYSITQKELAISVPGASRLYDGSNTIHYTGQAALVGVVSSDQVVINSGNVTGFVDKNVGVNKPVTYTGFTFNGNDASNYVLLANPASTAEITPKPITASGIAANDKVYNATTAASLNAASATLTRGALSGNDNKVYSSDNVSVDTSLAVGTFANANVGTAKPVTITGLALSGNDAGNYTVTDTSNATASITAKALTVSGLSAAASRVYNGTLGATVTGTPTLLTAQAAGSGSDTDGAPYAGDVIGFTGSATGTYNSKDVSSANTVTFGGLASSNNNYTLSLGTQAATITAKTLTVSGLSAPSSRVYDGTQVAIASGTPSLLTAQTAGAGTSTDGTPYVGDVVGFNGTASATYNTKDVGTATTISFGGLASNNTNYTLAFGTQAGSITPKTLTVSGLSVASSREYNAALAATVTGTPTLLSSEAAGSGSSNDGKPYATDTIGFNGAATGTYNSKDVASASTVTLSGLTSDNSNYALSLGTQAATITPKALTVTSTTVANKSYDGTTAATLSNGRLVGVLSSDTAHVSLNEAGNFVDKNVGIAKPVTSTSTITGTEAGNYSLTQPTGLSADITKADLAVTGVSAVNKVYDATRTATLTGTATVVGLGSDVVSATGTGTGVFADKNVGTTKPVTVTGYTLTGTDAGNYNPLQPVGVTADITPKPVTAMGIIASNKVYDGTTAVTLSNGSLAGVIASDAGNVTLTQSGVFANKDAGTAKAVNITGALAGTEAGNYSLTQPTGVTADISKAPLTVTAANAAKVFGETNPALTATVSGFVAGETLATSGVTGSPAATTTATTNTAAGTAVISASAGTLAATNYEFSNLVDGTLTIRAMTTLSNNEVAALIGSRLNTLSAAQLGSFSASQMQVFSPAQLAALTPSQMAGITAEQINAMPLTQLVSLSPAQIGAITPAHMAGLTATQLSALSEAQLQALSPEQIASIAIENFGAFTSEQIMALPIAQVQSLSSTQLASFTPSQVASLHAAELAYFDALQRATAGKGFEAPIPVMTDVAEVKAPAASVEVANIKPLQALPQVVVSAEAPSRTGVLAVTILNSADAKPLSAGVAYEQVADTISLRATAAPAVPPLSDKVVFTDSLTTFMVAATNGEMVEFQGSLVNNRMVIVAPSLPAKRVARAEMNLVLAAAVTSLGKANRVMLANLEGVVLDLR